MRLVSPTLLRTSKMNLQVPTLAPRTSYPVLTRANAQMNVYSNFPDEQNWIEEALAQRKEENSSGCAIALQELGAIPWGAPLGSFSEESLRVARTSGVFVESKDEVQTVCGAAHAHARCWAFWTESEDGPVLVVEFQEPVSFGWGVGKDRLAQEQLKALCLRQLKPQADSLLENLADVDQAARLQLSFTGQWDDSSEFVRRSLSQHLLNTWQRLTREAGAPDMSANSSAAVDEQSFQAAA